MKLRNVPLLACIAVAAASGAAHAATDTTQFQVKITITESCDVHTVNATDIDFGTHVRSTDATPIDNQGALQLNCSRGTPYQIALDPGLHFSSGTAAADNRRMLGADNNYVPYGLYRDAARTQFWGRVLGTNTVAGIGNAAPQSIPVFGRVPATNVPAGVYLDTITATVTY